MAINQAEFNSCTLQILRAYNGTAFYQYGNLRDSQILEFVIEAMKTNMIPLISVDLLHNTRDTFNVYFMERESIKIQYM